MVLPGEKDILSQVPNEVMEGPTVEDIDPQICEGRAAMLLKGRREKWFKEVWRKWH